MLATNSDEIPNMLATSQIVIGVFSRQVSQLGHIFFCCAFWWTPENSACLTEVTTLLNLENYSKTCVIHVSTHSSNAILNILKSCVEFFTNNQQHLMQTYCYFKSVILLAHQNCKWNSILLHLTWHYSTVTHTTFLFQTGNDHGNSTLFTSNERSLCYQQQWSHGQSRNWSHHNLR